MSNISTISRYELREKLEQKQPLVLLEALAEQNYNQAHLPGALQLLAEEAETRSSTLIPNKDSEVIVYCANAACQNSTKLALKLKSLGYTNVKDYEAGKEDWLEAKLPVESAIAA